MLKKYEKIGTGHPVCYSSVGINRQHGFHINRRRMKIIKRFNQHQPVVQTVDNAIHTGQRHCFS